MELQVAYITTNGGQYISNGSIPAVMLAVDKVNNASSGRYHLQVATRSISVSHVAVHASVVYNSPIMKLCGLSFPQLFAYLCSWSIWSRGI